MRSYTVIRSFDQTNDIQLRLYNQLRVYNREFDEEMLNKLRSIRDSFNRMYWTAQDIVTDEQSDQSRAISHESMELDSDFIMDQTE